MDILFYISCIFIILDEQLPEEYIIGHFFKSALRRIILIIYYFKIKCQFRKMTYIRKKT